MAVDHSDGARQRARRSSLTLYRNDGRGHFADVSAAAGFTQRFYGMGVAVGDYDNDGWTDVFVTAVGASHLYRNSGGRFTEVTAAAGVGGQADAWSTCAAWFDYDNDADLDLFVCHYVRWSRAIDLAQDFRLTGIGRAYGPPRTFEGAFPTLYRNDGRGHFTDVSASAGVQVKNASTGVPLAKSLGVAPIDLDADGWIDLVVANDTVPNLVFHNQHDGTFREVGASSGVAFDSYGAARSAMGIDAADFRNDGSIGIAIGNFANEMTALYVSQREGLQFADEAIQSGVGPESRRSLTFGVLFVDYDLDGSLDLLTANGHIEDEINKVQASQQYAQPPQLFWNAGRAAAQTFVPVAAAADRRPGAADGGSRQRVRRHRRRRRPRSRADGRRWPAGAAPQRSTDRAPLDAVRPHRHPLESRCHRSGRRSAGGRTDHPAPGDADAELPLAVAADRDDRVGASGRGRIGDGSLAGRAASSRSPEPRPDRLTRLVQP